MNTIIIPLRELVAAIYSIGPIPTALSARLGIPVTETRRAISANDVASELYREQMERVARAIEATDGDLGAMARWLQVSQDSVRAMIAENVSLHRLYDDKRAEFVTVAEAQLRKALNRGERWAVELVLNSPMGVRAGFGKVTQVTNLDIEGERLGQDPAVIRERITRALLQEAAGRE